MCESKIRALIAGDISYADRSAFRAFGDAGFVDLKRLIERGNLNAKQIANGITLLAVQVVEVCGNRYSEFVQLLLRLTLHEHMVVRTQAATLLVQFARSSPQGIEIPITIRDTLLASIALGQPDHVVNIIEVYLEDGCV